MGPKLSQRLGRIVGLHFTYPGERFAIIDAAAPVDTWGQLPADIRAMATTIATRDSTWRASYVDLSRAGVTKAAKDITAAGIAVRAADTGRVLMLQRALPEDSDDDPNAGMWEFPGGRLEDGEKPKQAAKREWQEETGCELPDGDITGKWTSGPYRGYVYTVDSEDDVDIHGDRDDVDNPDDPDGDNTESLAWWDPGQLTAENPAIRQELRDSLPDVLDAIGAETSPRHLGKMWDDLPAMVSPETLAYLHSLFGEDGTELFNAALTKVEQGAVGRYRARHLIRWYERGEGAARIRWGEPGDWSRCVRIASEHMRPDQAKGFCNLRHHGALGFYPATHAAMERGHKVAHVDIEKGEALP